MVGCLEDVVGGEGEVVDPVGVGGQGGGAFPSAGLPDLDCFVLGGGVELAETAPADAGYRAFVTSEDDFDASECDVPDADC